MKPLKDSNLLETPIDKLYSELGQLKMKNSERKTQIRSLRRDIDETVEKRDRLNAEVKHLADEIRKLKSQRDSLNTKVKELKQKRDELRVLAAQKRELLSKLLEKTRHISDQLRGSMSELLRQINGIEWYIQTNPLAPKTEKNLIAKISVLEVELAKHKGLRDIRDKLLKLKIEIGALRIQAQSTHEELTKIAGESEKVHASMQELVKVLTEKRTEADAKHSEYLKRNEERREAIEAIDANLDRIEQIRVQIGEAKSSKFKKAEKLKLKYKEAASEKLRTGGKLSFEEFQALMGDSLPETDDE